MIVGEVFFAIIVLAFLMVAGTVLYGIVLAIGGWVGSLVESTRDSLSSLRPPTRRLGTGTTPDRSVISSDPVPGQLPPFSSDDMWAQMQGKRSPKRSRPGRGSP